MAKDDTLKFVDLVTDLHDLRHGNLRPLLYKLESIQTDLSLVRQGIYDGDLEELEAQEKVIKEVITEIWTLHFGENKDGCG